MATSITASKSRQDRWTAEEDEFVRAWYADHVARRLCLTECGRQLGRSRQAVGHRAMTLGLVEPHRQLSAQVQAIVRQPRHATEDERRRAIGRATKQRIAEHGHPRGARGLQHTPEHLEKMHAGARRWRNEASPEERTAVKDKQLATCLARYGTMAPASLARNNPYSHAKRGRRADLGNVFFRSMWEANYARFLNFLQAGGIIRRWEYEADTFWFEAIRRGVRSYTPDFKVTDPDGSVHYEEVKGWMDPKSKTKLARMKKYHPTVDLRVIDAKAYREIARKLGGCIPGWEVADRRSA